MRNNGAFSLSINEDHEDAVEKEEIDGDEQSEKVIFIGLGLVLLMLKVGTEFVYDIGPSWWLQLKS